MRHRETTATPRQSPFSTAPARPVCCCDLEREHGAQRLGVGDVGVARRREDDRDLGVLRRDALQVARHERRAGAEDDLNATARGIRERRGGGGLGLLTRASERARAPRRRTALSRAATAAGREFGAAERRCRACMCVARANGTRWRRCRRTEHGGGGAGERNAVAPDLGAEQLGRVERRLELVLELLLVAVGEHDDHAAALGLVRERDLGGGICVCGRRWQR